LVAVLLYLREWWIVSILSFWLAYKAKEVAVFFPCAMAILEWSRGRRWWRLIPFFAISVSFGLQAIAANRARDDAYTIRFGLGAVAACVVFYAKQAVVPLLPVAAMVWRDRRLWWSLTACGAMMIPLLMLPGRLFAVYLYVPLIALIVGLAFAAEAFPTGPLAAVAALWLGFVYFGPLREYRRAELTVARENKTFFEAVCRTDATVERKGIAYHEGGPPHMAKHGIEGAIHLCYSPEIELRHADPQREGWPGVIPAGVSLFHWQASPPAMVMERNTPSSAMQVFQLTHGWFPWTGHARWSLPRAEARLWHETDQNEFRLRLHPGDSLEREIVIVVDGAWIGDARINRAGAFERSWPVKPLPRAAWRNVVFEIRPSYRPPGVPHEYGLPFVDFRFRRKP
jgi:hypothetical protein